MRRRTGAVSLGLLLWVALNLWAVMRRPPAPVVCFEIMTFDGKRFVGNGKWKCL